MRIKKILGTVGLVGNILNKKSTSKKDAYSCDYINKMLSNVYPVGSIYLSVNDISPSTIFGGTWEQIKDRFLLGCGDNYENGATGGEATHKLTETEMPVHSHYLPAADTYGKNYTPTSEYIINTKTMSRVGTPVAGGLALTDDAGGNQSHNNMPPYLAVYIWKRIK